MPGRQRGGMKDRWPVVVFTALLTIAVAVQVAGQLGVGSCTAPLAAIADNKAICSPFEFWLNRYQSTLAALIAASFAYATIRGFQTQMRLTSRQLAPETIRALKTRAELIDKDLQTIREMEMHAGELERRFALYEERRTWSPADRYGTTGTHDLGQNMIKLLNSLTRSFAANATLGYPTFPQRATDLAGSMLNLSFELSNAERDGVESPRRLSRGKFAQLRDEFSNEISSVEIQAYRLHARCNRAAAEQEKLLLDF